MSKKPRIKTHTRGFGIECIDPKSGSLNTVTQLGLPFPIDRSSASFKDSTTELNLGNFNQELKKIRVRLRARGLQQQRILKKAGIRLFHAITENDRTSVEADFGAPAHGLKFAFNLVTLPQAYRYAPVNTVEGVLKTHVGQAIKIGQYLYKNGYHIFKDVKEKNYPSHLHFINGGVTAGFNAVMQRAISKHEAINDERKNYNLDTPAVILVPVPTYGLFLYCLEKLTAGTSVDVRPVKRLETGAVDQRSLQCALEECTTQGKRVIAYYDCTPHNPTGHIRTEAETRSIAALLNQHSQKQIDTEIKLIDDENSDIEFSNAWQNYPKSGLGQLLIIDDMAYEGLELTGRKPFSFGQVSPEVAKQTITLKGVSKIGLPGARIGLVIGTHDIIESLADETLYREFTAHNFGVDIITARYSYGEQQRLFKNHSKNLQQEHRLRLGMLSAMINGLNESNSLTMQQKTQLVADYAEYKKISKTAARKLLTEGLPYFDLKDDVEAGFFTVLNLEQLRNQQIYMMYGNDKYPRNVSVSSSNTMYWVLKSFGIESVPLVSAGASDQHLETRVSFSLKKDDLFTLFDRLHDMHSYFFADKTEIQLDLFRNRHKTKPKTPAP